MRRAVPWIAAVCLLAGIGVAAGSHVEAARNFGKLWSERNEAIAGAPARAEAMPLPGVVLWAWERPDDLSGIQRGEAGVAYLAGTMLLREGGDGRASDGNTDGVAYRPRLQPLKIATDLPRMPVVRIETNRGPLTAAAADVESPSRTSTSHLTAAQRGRVVDTLAQVASASEPPMIQVDFDAAVSERPFYESLLTDLRKRLGPNARISLTALASWCEGDAWLAQLPAGTIDEAVPMLFRMGRDATRVEATLANQGDFRAGVCRASVGISDDEPLSRSILTGQIAATRLWSQKRIYVFHNGTWNSASTLAVLGDLKKWHADFSRSR